LSSSGSVLPNKKQAQGRDRAGTFGGKIPKKWKREYRLKKMSSLFQHIWKRKVFVLSAVLFPQKSLQEIATASEKRCPKLRVKLILNAALIEVTDESKQSKV